MFTALALKLGISKRLLVGGGIALLVVAILMLTYCAGRDNGRSGAEKARLEGNVEALEEKGRADENAAGARLRDAQRANDEQTELKEAVDAEDDPAAKRAAYYRCLGELQAARKSNRPAPSCG